MNYQTVIYAKNPIAGKVKTRIAKSSNNRFATKVYQSLLQATLQPLAKQKNTVLACAPTLRHGYIKRVAGSLALKRHIQPCGTLGQRMNKSVRLGLKNHDAVIIIGTDCPQLTPTVIQSAVTALKTHDVYIQAANDGGYVLIACKRYCPALFQQINWSSPQVLAQTKRQARAAGIRLCIGLPLTDVDELKDWREARRQGQAAPLWHRHYSLLINNKNTVESNT